MVRNDVLNVPGVLPDMIATTANGAIGESNTVAHFNGGYMWIIPPESGTNVNSTGFRFDDCNNVSVKQVSFYIGYKSSGIRIGNTQGHSVGSIEVIGNRTEGYPGGGTTEKFVEIVGGGATGLAVKNNSVQNTDYIVYDATVNGLTRSDIGPNNTPAGGSTYVYSVFNLGRHFDLQNAASFSGTLAASDITGAITTTGAVARSIITYKLAGDNLNRIEPLVGQNIPDNTTPSVKGMKLGYIVAAAPINITDLLDGIEGQELLIIGASTNGVLIDGGNLHLNGNWTSNYTNNSIRLIYTLGVWIEQGRL